MSSSKRRPGKRRTAYVPAPGFWTRDRYPVSPVKNVPVRTVEWKDLSLHGGREKWIGSSASDFIVKPDKSSNREPDAGTTPSGMPTPIGSDRARGVQSGTKPKRKGNVPKKKVKVDVEEEEETPVVYWRRPKTPSFKTRTKDKKEGIDCKKVQPRAVGSSFSYVYSRMNRYRKKGLFQRSDVKKLPKLSYELVDFYRMETALGKQNVFCYSYGTGSMLNVMAGTVAGLTSNTSQIMVEKYNIAYQMTNNSNCNMFLTIWDGYYRKPSAMHAVQAMIAGLQDEGLTTSPATILGMDPLKSKTFCQFCYVTNVRKVELGEGRSHEHKVVTYVDGTWNKEQYNMFSTAIPYLDNWSRFTIFQIKGAPVNDSGNTAAVTTGMVALDLVLELKSNFTYVQPNSEVSYLASNLVTVNTPRLWDPGAGASETNVTV